MPDGVDMHSTARPSRAAVVGTRRVRRGGGLWDGACGNGALEDGRLASLRLFASLARRVAALGPLAACAALVACGCAPIEQRIRTYHAERSIRRGEQLLAAEDLDSALAAFEQAVRLDSGAAVAHSQMGAIYRKLGKLDKAIECFSNAIGANPRAFEDMINLAQLYIITHRLKDAVEVYLAALDINPQDYDAQLSLGVCYQRMDEVDLAIERFNKAITVDPDQAFAYVNLGVALDEKGKYYEAIAAYQAALERDNEQPLVLVNLANTYMNQGRLKIARATLQQAIAMRPELAAAHEALGYCLFRMQQWDDAAQAYTDAISYDPHRAKAHVGLGSIDMLQFLRDRSHGQLRDRALEHWHRALEIDPNQPLVRNLIAKYTPDVDNPYDALLGVQEQDKP